MDTIHSPLDDYTNIYKAAFRRNAEAAFDDIIATSGINAQENKTLCDTIADTKGKSDELISTKTRWNILRTFAWILAVVGLPSFAYFPHILGGDCTTSATLFTLLGAVALVIILTILNPKIKSLKEQIRTLADEIMLLENQAWEQMNEVNALLSWDMPVKLIEKTVPKIKFDSYVNTARLRQMSDEFGFNSDLGDNTSILFAHSGEINGNPFAILTVRKHRMGTKVYTGSRTIYWTATTYDLNGKRHRVPRSQTLYASIEKPYPMYSEQSYLVYACDAAPLLKFHRKPEGLANDTSLFGSKLRRKKREIKRFTENLTDDSEYTMMSNTDFEACFETMNRNNEVEYRLLFTPIAQREMMKLLRDTREGYGDDFAFSKVKKINYIFPEHLNAFSLDTNPALLMDYNLEKMQRTFVNFCCDYFRHVYFAFAPLMSIPLYQQMRSQRNIYGDDVRNTSTHWEWEAMVNSLGEKRFAHSKSATLNILKTTELRSDGNKHAINVTSAGYSATKRTHRERVFGNDGRYHTVEVEWVEYKPVSNDSLIELSDRPDLDNELLRNKQTRQYSTIQLRRRLLVE